MTDTPSASGRSTPAQETAPGVSLVLNWPGKEETLARARHHSAGVLKHLEAQAGAPGQTNDAAMGRGLLVTGDNAVAAASLRATHAGKIDLVYIDPPFATGHDHAAALEIGTGRARSARARTAPARTRTAYRDRWQGGLAEYLNMLLERIVLIRPLLAPTGSLFVHVDRRVAHHLRFLLDEVFGSGQLVNEIIWCYMGPSSPGMRSFANKHDIILWYANGREWTFNADAVRLPYNPSTMRNEGRRTGFTTGDPNLVVKLHPGGKFPEDWWVIPVEAPASPVRTSYPTQKPERLLERVLLAASNPGDLVADFFCGSGTTLAVAERLGRRWLGCDQSPAAIHTARKRLLALPTAPGFDVVRAEPLASDPLDAGSASRLEVEVEKQGPRCHALRLVDFAPSRSGLDADPGPRSADEVDGEIRTWSDWIDYWAIDWDWSSGPLTPDFVAFRTRRGRQLPLSSPPFELSRGGPCRAVVHVVDVLGRETRRYVDFEVAE